MSTYDVKSGDTLSKIANQHGLSVQELMDMNGIKDANKIQIGQKIKTSKMQPIGVWVNPNEAAEQWANQGLQQIGRVSTAVDQAREAREKNTQINPIPLRPSIKSQSKDDAINLQTQLVAMGYDVGKVDGIVGNRTNAALQKAQVDGYVLENGKLIRRQQKPSDKAPSDKAPSNRTFNPEVAKENVRRLGRNYLRSPLQTSNDAVLYGLDLMGVPSNATNYLRDLNVSIPYRVKNAAHAVIDTFNNDKSFKENYDYRLENPSKFVQRTTISPLINSNRNFSEEELAVVRDAAGSDFKINNADVKRVQEDGKYGGKGALSQYFSPSRVFATAIGQSSGNPEEKTITDLFDVNVKSKEAQRDNKMYTKMLQDNLKSGDYATYENLRATMPYLNMTDAMPDQFKIQTKIKYEN